jgi:regulator of protease activity HflC (stomatin/prohibitin superfamily)
MFLFILALIFLIGVFICVGGFIVKPKDYSNSSIRPYWVGGGLVCLLLSVLMGLWSCVETVPASHTGIPVAFGEVHPALSPGVHFVAPWTDVHNFETRQQEITFAGNGEGDTYSVINTQAAGGGNLTMEMTVQFQIVEDQADSLYEEIGTDYLGRSLLPLARSCPRDEAARFSIGELFGVGEGAGAETAPTTEVPDSDQVEAAARRQLADGILSCMTNNEQHVGIEIIDVLIRDLDPGETVRGAIDDKIAAEQAEQQALVDERTAATEARIRNLEGENITPELLELRRLEILEALAESDTSTFVVPEGADVSVFAQPPG